MNKLIIKMEWQKFMLYSFSLKDQNKDVDFHLYLHVNIACVVSQRM